MKKIKFTVYYCGMSKELFSKNIMIYKPHSKYQKIYSFGHDISTQGKVSDLIKLFKADARNDSNTLERFVEENLQIDTVYLETKDALLKLKDDKLLETVFADFSFHIIHFAYFSVGGASFQFHGYKFIVHPNEEIHKDQPHVHVQRNENQTRYSLDTLKRFPNDRFCREFQRDEKRIIIPYLKENQKKLRRYWDYCIKGYIPPVEDMKGRQFYAES